MARRAGLLPAEVDVRLALRPLPPEPCAEDEALLRRAQVWPPDGRGYVRDPASGEHRHWSVMVALLRRDERREQVDSVMRFVLGGGPSDCDEALGAGED